MELYLLRHGVAEDAKPGISDASRSLTGEGRRKLRHTLHVACQAKVTPTLILSSPLNRTMETAKIAAEVFEYKAEILQSKLLKPGSTAEQAWDEIRGHREESALLLVGHNPMLSLLAAFLLGAPDLRIDMKKGALLKVTVDSFPPHPHGVLHWYLTAKLATKKY
jgi:phosphohistidine phosphatase